MLLTGFSPDVDLAYEHADGVPTACIQGNTASYGAATCGAVLAAGDDVGRWSSASSFICNTGILDRSISSTVGSVQVLKRARQFVMKLKGGTTVAGSSPVSYEMAT